MGIAALYLSCELTGGTKQLLRFCLNNKSLDTTFLGHP
jgi:hypothetical protein